jgi:chemotaxis protein methyltransferase CheR
MDDLTAQKEFAYSDADFERVRRILYRVAGISLSSTKQQMVYSRLARRLRALRLPDFVSYLAHLDRDAAEMEEFINALTTNLTSFFREPHHFDILAHYAKRFSDQGKKLRCWCTASSTGEEPYSIAMTLVEAYGSYSPPVEIIASDIDSKVLKEAERGVYPLARVESLSLARKKQFLQRGKGDNLGKARVIPELRKLIHFRQINLLDASWPVKGPFDVIFCRNVMIYFDKPTQMKLLERMIGLLHPEGLYVAGHSESFMQANHLVRLVGKTTYQLVNHTPDRAPA